MSTDELPPLPEADGYLGGFRDMPGYSDEQMRAYGQQCRNAALLEAAELCAKVAENYEVFGEPSKALAVAVCNVMLHAKMKEQT